jgi:hypothetical protein
MAWFNDVIVDQTPTGSSGLPVDFTGSADHPDPACAAPPFALLVRPIGGPFPVTVEGGLSLSSSLDIDNSDIVAVLTSSEAYQSSSLDKLCAISSSLDAVMAGSSSFTVISTADTSVSASVFFVSSSVSSVILSSGSATRKMLTVYNDIRSRCLYLKMGTNVDSDGFTVRIPPKGFYELPHPVYVGEVTAFWDAGAAQGKTMITQQS